MRYLSMFVVVILVFVFAISFAAIAAADTFSPRPVDPLAAETLARGVERSATVRAMVATLEGSNVIVHIQSSRELPYGIGGWTRFITSRGGYRYVRITIAADLPLRARSIILAHELQHACEIAESGAADAEGIRELFVRAGRRVGEFYETRAALETERHAALEMDARTTLQAEPVAKFDH